MIGGQGDSASRETPWEGDAAGKGDSGASRPGGVRRRPDLGWTSARSLGFWSSLARPAPIPGRVFPGLVPPARVPRARVPRLRVLGPCSARTPLLPPGPKPVIVAAELRLEAG